MTLVIDQFVHPVRWEGMGSIIILAKCEFQLIEVHKNRVQHPNNNISIVLDNVLEHPPKAGSGADDKDKWIINFQQQKKVIKIFNICYT